MNTNTDTDLESQKLETIWLELALSKENSSRQIFKTHSKQITLLSEGSPGEWILRIEYQSEGYHPELSDNFRDLRIEYSKQSSANNPAAVTIAYSLRNRENLPFWPHFAEDVIRDVKLAKSGKGNARAIEGVLAQWKKFWPSKSKLREPIARGLYGELYFMRQLAGQVGLDRAVNAWQGQDRNLHDFSLQGQAIEVKTVGARSLATISSLQQLDAKGVESLYLVSIRLTKTRDKKYSLQTLGDSLIAMASEYPQVQSLLRLKLAKSGWLKGSVKEREAFCYNVQAFSFYRVVEGFPRLTKSTLENLGRALKVSTYQVDLNHASAFRLSPEEQKMFWSTLLSPDSPPASIS